MGFIINGNAGIKEAPHVFYDSNETFSVCMMKILHLIL